MAAFSGIKNKSKHGVSATVVRQPAFQKVMKQFASYSVIQDLNPLARAVMRFLIEQTADQKRVTYISVNNRFEGNVPSTISVVVGCSESGSG